MATPPPPPPSRRNSAASSPAQPSTPPPPPASGSVNSRGIENNVYQQAASAPSSACSVCGRRVPSAELSYTANGDLACDGCAAQASAPREDVCSVCGFGYPPESMISRASGLICQSCAAPKPPTMRLVNAPKKKRGGGGNWFTSPITFGAGGGGLLLVAYIILRVIVAYNRAHRGEDPNKMTPEERQQINENLRQAEERQRQQH